MRKIFNATLLLLAKTDWHFSGSFVDKHIRQRMPTFDISRNDKNKINKIFFRFVYLQNFLTTFGLLSDFVNFQAVTFRNL